MNDQIISNKENFQPKNVRKFMTKLIKSALKIKNKNFDEVKKELIIDLNSFSKDITTIWDENNETLAHMSLKEDKYDVFHVIIETYISLLPNKEDFYNWFLKENNENQTVIEISVQNGNVEIIKYIFAIMSKTDESKFRLTETRSNLFHYAAMNNQCYPIVFFYENLQNFFKEDLLIDIPNKNGITPLHYACYKGCKEVMDLLLDLGVNIDAQDNDGDTCLHYAVKSENKRIIKKLLIRGAKKTLANKEGILPYQLAEKEGYNEIAEMLKEKTFFQSVFGFQEEIRGIKGYRNNILFVFILFLFFMAKCIYLTRLYLIYIGRFHLDFVPFVKSPFSNYKNQTFPIDSMEGYVKHCIFEKINNKCKIEASISVSSFVIDLIFTIMVCLFVFLENHQPAKSRKNQNEKSLSTLFEEHTDICVHCRAEIDANAVHCLICNACIKEFDHHCFWLNTCITKKTKRKFIVFIVLGGIFCIMNILFTGISKQI